MRPRWQFSLAQLFVWVALVAACFSLGKFFRSAGTGVMAVGLGVFTYLAFRRALRRASPTPTAPAEAAGREGRRPRTSWWWRLTVVLAALAGLWVLGVEMSTRLLLFGRAPIPYTTSLRLLWWIESMAVGASTAGLVCLWRGGSLGRWSSGVFALALGWLIVFAVFVVGKVSEDEDEHFRLLLLVAALEALVGILGVLFLPRYGARAARASAVAASAAVGIILLGAVIYTTRTLIEGGYIHVRHLILAVAGAWLAALAAGIVGGLVGAIGDGQGIARTQPVRPEGPPAHGFGVAPRRRWAFRAGKGRRVLPATIGLLLVAASLAILDLRSEHSAIRSFLGWLDLSIEHFEKSAHDAYWEYWWELKENAQRRQTTDLPPIDRVEVFLLDDARLAKEGFPTTLFPLFDWRDEDSYAPVLYQATLTGPDAEALAQMWRTRYASVFSSITLLRQYGLRFYAGRCLVLEVGEEYFTDGGQAYDWNLTLEGNEPLALRLQEIATLPDHKRADLAVERGRGYLREGVYEKAEAQFNRALQLDENAAGVAYLGLGRVLEAQGDPKGALAAYDKALPAYDKGEKARVAAMNAAMTKGLAVRSGPLGFPGFDQCEAFYRRARLHYAMRNYDLAMADVSRAIEHEHFRSPETSEYHTLRAAIHLDMGAPHAAIAELETAIQRRSSNAKAYELRAKAHRAIGKPEAAEEDLQKARDSRREVPQQDD